MKTGIEEQHHHNQKHNLILENWSIKKGQLFHKRYETKTRRSNTPDLKAIYKN